MATLKEAEALADQLSLTDKERLVRHLEAQLRQATVPPSARRQSYRGRWRGLVVDQTDIAAIRAELWGSAEPERL